MGYKIEITTSECVIPQENLQEAYRILKERYPEIWLEEADANDFDRLDDALLYLGFDASEPTSSGGLMVTGYEGKSHTEQQDFEAIAHLIRKGSYVDWRGEDGYLYRWFFTGEKLIEQTATITWS
jgi:hypothetical protein